MTYRIIPNVIIAGTRYVVEADIDSNVLVVLGVYEFETMRPLDEAEISALGDPLIDFCWMAIEGGQTWLN